MVARSSVLLEQVDVIAIAGDGGTFDIGIQALSGAVERGHDFLFVLYDNEAYMNTGIQVSSATPTHAWTGTTPTGNTRRKKQIMEVMAAHKIPYAATASAGFLDDLKAKVEKAKQIRGTCFIHVFSPCNTGWKFPEHLAPQIAVAAVESNVFPLYEVYDGREFEINHLSRGLPVEEYLKLQGRYKHLDEAQVASIQQDTDRFWANLRAKAAPVIE